MHVILFSVSRQQKWGLAVAHDLSVSSGNSGINIQLSPDIESSFQPLGHITSLLTNCPISVWKQAASNFVVSSPQSAKQRSGSKSQPGRETSLETVAFNLRKETSPSDFAHSFLEGENRACNQLSGFLWCLNAATDFSNWVIGWIGGSRSGLRLNLVQAPTHLLAINSSIGM